MNKLVLVALKKPYTFVVLAILIVLFGAMAAFEAPTDIFPNIQIPVTSVVWIYGGLMPQDVEGRITYLFERFLTSTVEGIKYIHSHSYFGSSITNIFLQDGVDVGGSRSGYRGALRRTSSRRCRPIFTRPWSCVCRHLHTGGHARKSAPTHDARGAL